MRRRDHSIRNRATVLALVAALSISVAGCGDDDVVVSGVTLSLGAATQLPNGILCVPFTATGPTNTLVNLLFEYSVPASPGVFIVATPVSTAQALAQTPAITSDGTNPVSANTGATGSVSGTFYWAAGADLGFLAISPGAGNLRVTAQGSGAGAGATSSTAFGYAPTVPVQASSGAGAGATPGAPPGAGRADHTAFSPGDDDVVIAGGHSSSLAAYPTIDRFHVDVASLTHTLAFSGQMGVGRTDHAASFYLDPVTSDLKLLVTGGVATATAGATPDNSANVYCFTPTELVTAASNLMSVARRGHTATWAPNGRVYVIGGQTGPGVGTATIEAFVPAGASGSFVSVAATLASPRRGHTATLLPNGHILIAGGFDPASSATPLPAELFDTTTETMVSASLGTVDLVNHTATRLSDGHVLLAGGQLVSNPSSFASSARIFFPELGGAGAFTVTAPVMSLNRASHSAILLGDGNVLITGGDTATGTTNNVEIFLAPSLTFSPVATVMTTPRADHTTTAIENGTVVVVAGRNGSTFLDTLETFPQNNATPTITGASFSAGVGGVGITVNATDPDGDGGYAIVRVRSGGSSGPFNMARLVAGSANSDGGLNAGTTVYLWDATAQGFAPGSSVEVEVIPVGATVGTPFRFTAVRP
ncbi:MAG TPA: kelch repeat-containing protein [Planctomycetota bacterium]|nr:kelch repeat-containing protein [Planctomycetota bacterium]